MSQVFSINNNTHGSIPLASVDSFSKTAYAVVKFSDSREDVLEFEVISGTNIRVTLNLPVDDVLKKYAKD